MHKQLFQGSRLKIARGREHASDLENRIIDYFGGEPWVVLLQLDRRIGTHRLAMKGREEIPAIFSIVFGDAVHNFRSALDILANELVAATGEVPKKVYFPFGDSEAGFEKQMKEKLRQAPLYVQSIIRNFKPYRGGNETLRALHDLDISDKHVAVMSAHVSAATGPLPVGRRTVSPSPIPGHTRITVEADFGALSTTPIDLTGFPADIDATHINTIGRVNGSEISLVISKDLPLEGMPVISSLNSMGDIAEAVVAAFE